MDLFKHVFFVGGYPFKRIIFPLNDGRNTKSTLGGLGITAKSGQISYPCLLERILRNRLVGIFSQWGPLLARESDRNGSRVFSKGK